MERYATIALLIASVAALGYLKMEQLELRAVNSAAAEVHAEENAAKEAAEKIESAKIRFTIPHDMDAYTADITVSLDGSGSFDAEGDSLSFYWDQTSGDQVYLDTADSKTATFRATPGEYTFMLTVSDSYGSFASGSTTIAVAEEPNSPPEVVVEVY